MNNGYSDKLLTTPDVLVIGGGSAGVAAAVGAAQQGASVTLIEKNSFGEYCKCFTRFILIL